MYRFLRSPKWIFGHVLVLIVVVGFTNLGFWQLRRLDETRAHNAHVMEHLAAAPVPLDEALREPVPFTRVVVAGEYLPDGQVLTGPRSRDGNPGNHVLTPLETAHGTVLVDRGWVPFEGSADGADEIPVPGGEIEVSGLLMEAEEGPAGESEFVQTIDPAEVSQRTGLSLPPHYVQLQESRPAQEGPPLVHADPVVDDGNHLSYAVQWFLFTGVVLVGYPILLRHTSRDHSDRRRVDGDDPGGGRDDGNAAEDPPSEPPGSAARPDGAGRTGGLEPSRTRPAR